MRKGRFFGFVLLVFFGSLSVAQKSSPGGKKMKISDGYSVLEAMKKAYKPDKWYRNFTFTQDIFFYKDGKETKKEVWHEASSSPGKLCIKFHSMDSQDGVIFANGKVSSVKSGTVASSRTMIHELLLAAFDVYFLDTPETKRIFDSLGYDMKVVHQDIFDGRKVYVAGALAGDKKSPQIWIDAERWYLHRIIYKNKDALRDCTFGDYEKIGGNWIAKTITFKNNGVLDAVEKYYNIKFPKELDPAIFDPVKFEKIKEDWTLRD